MVKTFTTTIKINMSKQEVLDLAGDPQIMVSFWKFLKYADLESKPIRVTLRFRKFGISKEFDYDLEISKEEDYVIYSGKAQDREFQIRIELKEEQNGLQAIITVSYKGPYESLSLSFLKEFAEDIAKGLKALERAYRKKQKSKLASRLSDPSYLLKLMTQCKLLTKRKMIIADYEDLQSLLYLLQDFSRNTTIFVRINSNNTTVRMLVKNGQILDFIATTRDEEIQGPHLVDKMLDLLEKKDVDLLIFEAPE
ncbi:MAG: hypothetical protein GSR77_07210 [Desulfurococcales archaeon]|nr:hypothetical protein [Desulfurococcales archaeon]